MSDETYEVGDISPNTGAGVSEDAEAVVPESEKVIPKIPEGSVLFNYTTQQKIRLALKPWQGVANSRAVSDEETMEDLALGIQLLNHVFDRLKKGWELNHD